MKLVLRNIMRRKGRSLYAVIGIAIGISIIVAIITISQGIRQSVTDLLMNERGDLLVLQDNSTGFYNSMLPDTLGKEIEKIEGVTQVEPYSVIYSNIKPVPPNFDDLNFVMDRALDKTNLQFPIMGIDMKMSSLYASIVNKDEYEKRKSENKFKIFLGANQIRMIESKFEEMSKMFEENAAAENMSKMFLVEASASDFPVLNLGNKKYKFPKFKIKDKVFEVAGIFKTDTIQDTQAFIDIQQFKELFDQQGFVNSYMVYLDDPDEVETVRQEIGKIKTDREVKAEKPIELMNMFSDRIETMNNIIWALMMLAGFSGAIGVLNTMASNVSERTKEIGLLLAVGWSKSRVVTIILLEGLFLAVIGGIFGILVGIVEVEILRAYIPESPIPDQYSLFVMLQGMLIAIIVGFVGSFIPAFRAARLYPVEALRYE